MNRSQCTPLRVGVISDTHLSDSVDAQEFLRDLVERVLAPVDMLLHVGDLVAPTLLDVFSEYPIHAVRGNMDPVVPGVSLKKVLTVRGFTIGMMHGWGAPAGLEERVHAEFLPINLNCLVYGHSHRPVCHRRGGILFFNPGSATDRRRMAYHSVGLLEIGKDIRGTIIKLD
jgi:putative phosphoesterase